MPGIEISTGNLAWPVAFSIPSILGRGFPMISYSFTISSVSLDNGRCFQKLSPSLLPLLSHSFYLIRNHNEDFLHLSRRIKFRNALTGSLDFCYEIQHERDGKKKNTE